MFEIRILARVLLACFLAVGCVPVPVIGLTPIFVGDGSKNFDLSDYSLGPVSSDQFPVLVETAMLAGEEKALLFGRVEMTFRKDIHPYDFSAVAVLSETDIALLKWYKPDEQYRILARLPYPEIHGIARTTWGLGRTIFLCLATTDLVLAGQSHTIERLVSMAFIEPSGFLQDKERADAAFALLQERINSDDFVCDTTIERTEPAGNSEYPH